MATKAKGPSANYSATSSHSPRNTIPSEAADFKRAQQAAVSLRILEVTLDKLQKLQLALAGHGTIKSMDTLKLKSGMLTVEYFHASEANNAYNDLKANWKDVKVEYHSNPTTNLSSINESSDSAGSEKSEESNESARKAKESLKQIEKKIKDEYENFNSDSSEDKGSELFNTTCVFRSGDLRRSDLSLDNETINEETKVNLTPHLEPRLLPKNSPSSNVILHTESTNNDQDDSWVRPLYFDSPEGGIYVQSSENAQLLRTQPVSNPSKLTSQHVHTKSYDLTALKDLSKFVPFVPRYYKQYENNYYPSAHKASLYIPNYTGTAEETKTIFKIHLREILAGKDSRTTLMIRNIPNKYTQKMLLEKINSNHSMEYDFFYLPIDQVNNCNVGYAFINFVSPYYILRFYAEMNAKKWERFNSEKRCQLAYARIQSLEGLQEHFKTIGSSQSVFCFINYRTRK